jgi:plastocyanin
MRTTWMLALVAGLTLSACSGGGGTAAKATCHPSGTALTVTAQNTAFDTDCLAAPAGHPFTIAFDNKDGGTSHNVAIYTDSGTNVFRGEVFVGPKTETYHVGALKPGTYEFRCDVHATMRGAFVVK